MTPHLLIVDQEGNVETIHTDIIPLNEIGTITATRASTVEFNHLTQEWEVAWTGDPGRVAFSHPSRQVCVDWEVGQLQTLMEGAFCPMSV